MKEILLYSTISNSSFFGNTQFINDLVTQIKDAEGGDILLRINSPGGSVFDGYALITNLSEHSGEISMKVDGLAASMAGILLAYSDYTEASEFSRIMLHKAWSYRDDEDTKNLLETMNKDFASILKRKGVDSKLVNEIFLSESKKDYWFTAKEAKKIGLINKVIKSKVKIAASVNFEDEYYSTFGNVENKITYNNKHEVEMFGKKEQEELEAKFDKLQEDFTTSVNEFATLKKSNEELVKVNNTLTSKNEKLDEEIANLNKGVEEKEKIEAEAGETISKAIENLETTTKEINSSIEKNKTSISEIKAQVESLIETLGKTVSNFKIEKSSNEGDVTSIASLDDEINNKNMES